MILTKIKKLISYFCVFALFFLKTYAQGPYSYKSIPHVVTESRQWAFTHDMLGLLPQYEEQVTNLFMLGANAVGDTLHTDAWAVYVGKITMVNNPAHTIPPRPGMVLALQTDDKTYVLNRDGVWVWDDAVIIDEEVYKEGDSVEIHGTTNRCYDLLEREYYELAIRDIKKIPTTEDYFPENKIWSVYDEVSNMGFGSGYFWKTYLHYVKGEQELDGKVWKQFYRANKEDKSDERPCFLLLQEGQKVYKDTITNLIFDFGAQKGDIIWKEQKYAWGSSSSEGIQIDSVYYRSFMEGRPPRKCLDVSLRYYTNSYEKDTADMSYSPYFSDTWVEGWGSLRMGGLVPGEFMAAGGISYLLCVHQNGEQEYQHRNFQSCFVPAPVEGSFAGRIVKIAKPQPWQSPDEGEVYALAVDTDVYFLRTYNCFFWSDDPSGYPCSNQVENITRGDSVGIRGYLALRQEQNGKYYYHLLVDEIRKLPTATHVVAPKNLEIELSDNNKRVRGTWDMVEGQSYAVEFLAKNQSRILRKESFTFDYNSYQFYIDAPDNTEYEYAFSVSAILFEEQSEWVSVSGRVTIGANNTDTISEPTDTATNYFKQAVDLMNITVLPNPNNGNFRMEVNRPCSVEIYTETGVLVESRKLDAGTHNFSLGTGKNAVGRAIGGAGKAAGLYILKATAADGQMLTRKIAVN